MDNNTKDKIKEQTRDYISKMRLKTRFKESSKKEIKQQQRTLTEREVEIRKERAREWQRLNYKKNKEKILEQQKRRKNNRSDEQIKRDRLRARLYYKNNRKKMCWHSANYFERKMAAKPEWADVEKMTKVYEKRLELNEKWGVDFVVDHIVPIRSKKVCGLHVWNNLQLLDRKLNSRKSNKVQV